MIKVISTKFNIKDVFVALLLVVSATASAQSAVTAAGGDGSSSSGSFSYTVGEASSTKSASICEGVQQSSLEVEETGQTTSAQQALTADIKVYPNPVADVLNVECKGMGEGTYRIYSSNGAVLTNGACGDGKTSIDMSEAVPGVYSMIIESDGRVKSYKIIKKTR